MNELNMNNIREHINNIFKNDMARKMIYHEIESKTIDFSEVYNRYKSLKEKKENNISDEEVKDYFNL